MTITLPEIQKALGGGISEAQALAVLAAASELWDQLAYYGLVDDFNSAECARVLPQALRFIHVQANLGPGVT